MRERISGTSALFQLYAGDDFPVYQPPASLAPSHPLHEQVVLSQGHFTSLGGFELEFLRTLPWRGRCASRSDNQLLVDAPFR